MAVTPLAMIGNLSVPEVDSVPVNQDVLCRTTRRRRPPVEESAEFPVESWIQTDRPRQGGSIRRVIRLCVRVVRCLIVGGTGDVIRRTLFHP